MPKTSDFIKSTPLVIPVKSFSRAKMRLTKQLDDGARAALAQKMAENVVQAAGTFQVMIASDGEETAKWAETLGLEIIDCEGLDLNASIEKAAQFLASQHSGVIVAHGDLPKASTKSFLAVLNAGNKQQMVIVPDRHLLGTNVLYVPLKGGAEKGFTFQYGPGSFEKHQMEAERLGLGCLVLKEADLMLDIDTPEDLDEL